MFQNLKHQSGYTSVWRNKEPRNIPNANQSVNANNFHHSPGTTTFQVKGNEADRMVRCRICGFPCDRERDGIAQPDSWAGLGVTYGQQLTAGTSIGDRRVPAAGVVATTVDQYYNITSSGGCPCCHSFTYYL